VHIDMSPRNVDLVGEGFDLAVRMGPLEDSTSLTATRLASVPMVLVATRTFLSQAGPIEHPRDLLPAWCLSLADRPWTFSMGKARASVRPAGRMSSNSGGAALHAAIAGLGVALVPAYYLPGPGYVGDLVHLLPGWRPAESSTFYLVYPTGKYLPERVRQLIDHLRRSVSDGMPG
jgi:DNA-binding transcriptional LysR family regulator